MFLDGAAFVFCSKEVSCIEGRLGMVVGAVIGLLPHEHQRRHHGGR